MLSALVINLLSIFISIFPATETGLHVKVLGLKSNDGNIILGVFKNNGSFPTIGEQYKGYELQIKDKKASIWIKDLPKGTYAIGICHDLNSNNKMDKNFIGFPQEPYGMSKNVRGYLSNPTFAQASFYFDGSMTLEIKVE
jgi:uncharacterized protein (DUF2141 family)